MIKKYEIENLEYSLTAVQNQQSKIDGKANIFIAFHVAIIGFLVKNLLTNTFDISIIKLVTLIFLCVFIISIYHLTSLQIPKKYDIQPSENLNILNFAQINVMKLEDFKNNITNLENVDGYANDLLSQIHINSQILIKKQEKFKLSMRVLKFGSLLCIILLGIVIIYNMLQ